MKICVFGAASPKINQEYYKKVYDLSKTLAENGNSLVFGAGSSGLMGAAAYGFSENGGYVEGVIPKFFEEEGYEAIFYKSDKLNYTNTMSERKTMMEDLADAFIITPGGVGTLEEFFEVLTLKQLGRHKKPVVVYNIDGFYNDLNSFFKKMRIENAISKECYNLFTVFDKKEDIIEYLKNYNTDNIEWNRLKKM